MGEQCSKGAHGVRCFALAVRSLNVEFHLNVVISNVLHHCSEYMKYDFKHRQLVFLMLLYFISLSRYVFMSISF